MPYFVLMILTVPQSLTKFQVKKQLQIVAFLSFFFLIGVKLLYNAVLVSAVQ